jgi:hypothetical protein
MRADSLEVIILKQREIEKNLVAIQKSSLKTTEVRNSFKGTVAGVILTIIVDQVLHVVKDHKQSIKLRRWETLIQTYKGYPLKKYKSSKTLTCLTLPGNRLMGDKFY